MLLIDLKKLWPLLLALPLIVFSLFLKPDTGGAAAPASGEKLGPVLVIDPGHGGEDGGAVGVGGLLESGVNLSVSLRLEALAGFMGVETVLTRTGEDIDYPESAKTTAARKRADQRGRAELINSTPGAVLMSIHQNCFPTAGPSGCQVLYAKTKGSAELGELAHGKLSAAVCPNNRRVAAPISNSIYLLKSVDCPAVLAECGFISNPQEAGLLTTEGHQIKIAAALLASYLDFLAVREVV